MLGKEEDYQRNNTESENPVIVLGFTGSDSHILEYIW